MLDQYPRSVQLICRGAEARCRCSLRRCKADDRLDLRIGAACRRVIDPGAAAFDRRFRRATGSGRRNGALRQRRRGLRCARLSRSRRRCHRRSTGSRGPGGGPRGNGFPCGRQRRSGRAGDNRRWFSSGRQTRRGRGSRCRGSPPSGGGRSGPRCAAGTHRVYRRRPARAGNTGSAGWPGRSWRGRGSRRTRGPCCRRRARSGFRSAACGEGGRNRAERRLRHSHTRCLRRLHCRMHRHGRAATGRRQAEQHQQSDRHQPSAEDVHGSALLANAKSRGTGHNRTASMEQGATLVP